MKSCLLFFALFFVLTEPRALAREIHFEIYGGTAGSEKDLRDIKRLGFNQVVLRDFGLAGSAEKLGLNVVMENWWGIHTPWAEVASVVARAKKLKTLVSVNFADEPILWRWDVEPNYYSPELYQQIYRRYRREVPFSITEYGPRPDWDGEDLRLFKAYLASIDHLRLTIFPVPGGRPLLTVHEWVRKAKRIMRELVDEALIPEVRPVTVVLQTFLDEPGPSLPTVSQLRVMAYIALFSGIEALSFFDYNPGVWNQFSPSFGGDFKAMLGELAKLNFLIGQGAITGVYAKDGVFAAEVGFRRGNLCMYVNTVEEPRTTACGKLGALGICSAKDKCRNVVEIPDRAAGISFPSGVTQGG